MQPRLSNLNENNPVSADKTYLPLSTDILLNLSLVEINDDGSLMDKMRFFWHHIQTHSQPPNVSQPTGSLQHILMQLHELQHAARQVLDKGFAHGSVPAAQRARHLHLHGVHMRPLVARVA